MPKKTYTIKETAELTGLSPSVLRVWELRYGWPKPRRHQNGYRIFTAEIIDDIQWVAERIQSGATICELIAEGKVKRDRSREVTPDRSRTVLDFSSIPQPTSPEGQRLRALMEQAMRTNDTGQQAYIESQAMRLRPQERELVVDAVKRVAQGAF